MRELEWRDNVIKALEMLANDSRHGDMASFQTRQQINKLREAYDEDKKKSEQGG